MKNYPFKFSHKAKIPLFRQISQSIINAIDSGHFVKNEILPTINEFSEKYNVARDTIERAYKEAKSRGYITSVKGRGYFVQDRSDKKMKVLLIFNKLSSYKKIVYYSIIKTLGEHAKVDLQIHHYDIGLLNEIIESNIGKYDYYVIMPHFKKDVDMKKCLSIINKIPHNELLLLDKDVEALKKNVKGISQDFKLDIYSALKSAGDLFKKYKAIEVVFPDQESLPLEIIDGIKLFCCENQKEITVVDGYQKTAVKKGTAYIVLEETDLGELIKMIKESPCELGKDIGILSFNETIFKELLDITVVSTDFEAMGEIAANMLLKNETKRLKNDFTMIKRGSL